LQIGQFRPAPDLFETNMAERTELEQAIVVLEAQRAILGDAIVDAGTAPIRE